jgi:hypothetical protein
MIQNEYDYIKCIIVDFFSVLAFNNEKQLNYLYPELNISFVQRQKQKEVVYLRDYFSHCL